MENEAIREILIIPAFNEAAHIGAVVKEARKYINDVIVVDDCSSDDTFTQAQDSGALVLRHTINLGKSAALKTGCEAANKLNAELLILMDGDGQHCPKDIPRLLAEYHNKKLNLVIGSRQLSYSNTPAIRFYGNKLLSLLIFWLYHVKAQDIQSGFRVFSCKDYLKYFNWKSNNYQADAEITVRAGKYHLACGEVPIQTIYLDKYKGMTLMDGIKLLLNLLIWKIT